MVAAAAALTAGCAADIAHGTITAKRYEPARERNQLQPIYGTTCTSTRQGSSRRTRVTAWIPQTITDPECYQLDLTEGHKHGSVCVSPEEYDHAQVGAQW